MSDVPSTKEKSTYSRRYEISRTGRHPGGLSFTGLEGRQRRKRRVQDLDPTPPRTGGTHHKPWMEGRTRRLEGTTRQTTS